MADAHEYSHEHLLSWTYRADAVARCRISHLSRLHLCPGYFRLGTFPCRRVEIVAIVVGVQEWEKKLTYTLDDGSDVIDCRQTKGEQVKEISIGDTVRCCGKIVDTVRRFGKAVSGLVHSDDPDVTHSRFIEVDSLDLCLDPTDEVRHWQRVSELHRTVYSQPFVITELLSTVDPHTPHRKRKSEETSSPGSLSETLASSASSPSTKGSPPRLRHPSKLRSSELTSNLFQTYLNAFLCAATDRQEDPFASDDLATPTKPLDFDATPRPKSRKRALNGEYGLLSRPTLPREPRGFTLSYLRRVPQLAELACRVVKAEAERRAAQQQNAQRHTHTKASNSSRHSSRRKAKGNGGWSETEDEKAKRLFVHTLRKLISEGSIVLGVRLSRPMDDLHLHADTPWCSQSRKHSSDFPSGTYPVTAKPRSPVRSDEESYLPVLPIVLRQHVLDSMQRLLIKGVRGVTVNDILLDLRRNDRWAYLGDWHVAETLRSMDGEGVCKRGQERWGLIS